MALSDYFTDEDLEQQIRMQFPVEQQYDMDFKTIFNNIVEQGDYLYLNFRGKKFQIDKLTAAITVLSEKEDEGEEY